MMGKRRLRFAFALLGVIILVLGPTIPQSFAHPVYVDSSPRAFQSVSSSPSEVSIFFSEPIELSYSNVKVLGSDGTRVDNNDPRNVGGDTTSIAVSLQSDIPEGVYTVSARVLSAVDGHVVTETFTFGIGVTSGGGTPTDQQRDILSPEESASRFPGMVGQVIVVGAAFGMLWLWTPLTRVPSLARTIAQQRISIDRNMMRLVIIGAGLVLASGVAMIIVQAVSINAGIPEAIATKFGNVWATRMLQSSILMGIAVAVYRKIVKHNTGASRAEIFAILILGFAVVVTSSLIAHAAATEEGAIIALDFFHNAAASIWIGGLILLGFIAVPKILAIRDHRIRAAAISILIPRFSTVVVTLLGIAVVTGPVLLFSLESDLSLTIASVYGQILAVKLALAGVMVAMGAYSQLVVQKKAIAVMVGGATVQTASLRHLGKTLKAEAGVGIALLFMVSLMANGALPSGQFPAYVREQQDGSAAFAEELRTDFSRTLYTSEGKIKLSISPFAVGQNSFKVSFFNQDGSSNTNIESATISLTQIEKGIGPITVEAKEQSDNVYSVDAAFGLDGVWNIEIEGISTQGNNMLGTFDAKVKPRVSNLAFTVNQYPTPERSMPLVPVFDAKRQSIWVGDTLPGSGRIWQLDIATGNYTVHRISGANLITQTVLAPDDSLWYLDPFGSDGKSTVGRYNPADNSSTRFAIPEEGVPSGLAIDLKGNIWVLVVQANKVVKLEPASGQFSSYAIPTDSSSPVGIAADSQGNLWFAEAAGNIGKIDPVTGNITEYAPRSASQSLDEPTAVFPEPNGFYVYVAEHNGKTITAFNSVLGTFREYPSANQDGLPFGMAMDSYGNLWFAEHQIDRVGVLDPRTGESKEARIPITGSFIQYLAADDRGRIWFAAQRGAALGSITITANAGAPPTNVPDPQGGSDGSVIQQLGFSFADLAGPAIAAGVIASAIMYSKSTLDLKRNIRTAMRIGE